MKTLRRRGSAGRRAMRTGGTPICAHLSGCASRPLKRSRRRRQRPRCRRQCKATLRYTFIDGVFAPAALERDAPCGSGTAVPRRTGKCQSIDARFALLNDAFATDAAVLEHVPRQEPRQAASKCCSWPRSEAAARASYPRLCSGRSRRTAQSHRAACQHRQRKRTSSTPPCRVELARGGAADPLSGAADRRAQYLDRHPERSVGREASYQPAPRASRRALRALDAARAPGRRARERAAARPRRRRPAAGPRCLRAHRARRPACAERADLPRHRRRSRACRLQRQGHGARRRPRQRLAPVAARTARRSRRPRSTCARSWRSIPTMCAAAHGATAGKLDDNMLFYLLSRGIERDTAQRC